MEEIQTEERHKPKDMIDEFAVSYPDLVVIANENNISIIQKGGVTDQEYEILKIKTEEFKQEKKEKAIAELSGIEFIPKTKPTNILSDSLAKELSIAQEKKEKKHKETIDTVKGWEPIVTEWNRLNKASFHLYNEEIIRKFSAYLRNNDYVVDQGIFKAKV